MRNRPAAPGPLNYRDAGVDIDAGNELVRRIRPLARATRRAGVLADVGGFGGLFGIDVARYPEPVLVAAADGVGTKLRLALELDRHDTIGIDLVAMCVNDVVAQGGEPLFFLDYFATGALSLPQAEAVIAGIANACERCGCALLGGETAEMPGRYARGEYDLAGFAVGIVNRDRIIDGAAIRPGDRIIGIASDGPHANGYSLIRKIIERGGHRLSQPFGAATLGEVLLKPTRLYAKPILALLSKSRVRGLAHITGGGLGENLARVLPRGCGARIDRAGWALPEIFHWLQREGDIETAEMYRAFNCGVGLCAVTAREDAEGAVDILRRAGETAFVIGEITRGGGVALS